MIKFEDFKNNIEVSDIFNVNQINVNKNVLYNGHHKLLSCNNTNKIKSQPLAAAVLGLNNTDIPLPNNVEFHNCWTDMDAQEAYLKQKPKCFLILGKQGTGSYSLGERLSKKINCIHLCPKNVLVDELDQQRSTGKCLDFNMRHNKVCKFNTILTIMKIKLKSPAVQHRGFVISGLPLVTSSKDLKYLFSTLQGEESLLIVEDILLDLICNLKKKKSTKKKSEHLSMSSENSDIPGEGEVEEEEQAEPELDEEENEEQIVELPKFLLESCNDIIYPSKVYYSTTKSVLLQQLYELFDLKPDIVIYITCPNADAVTKRSRKFLNYISSSNMFSSFTCNEESEIRWPTCYALSKYKKPFDTHVFNPKYNCAQPINFMKNATEQICNHKTFVTSFLNEKLKEFDPRFIIKLDGRTSNHQMLNHVMEILQVLPIKPVLIPEPLYLEEALDDVEEFWTKVEELNVIRSGIMNFNRYASPWYNRCPVQLKKRQSIRGNPRFAVTFFKHIYLLSSLDAMVSFCRNPRPFLKLEYLEPTCRIIILGTRFSGKTMVAKCLSWLFNAPIICYKTLLKNEALKKYNNYAKTILSEIIASIEDARFAQWQNLELERISNLNTWFNTVSSTLSSYVKLLTKKLNDESIAEDTVFLSKFNSQRSQLSFLPIDDLHECEDALIDKNLLKYAPACLTLEASKPKIPVLGDDDVTEAISSYIKSNELQKEIEPTSEELMFEVINLIQMDSRTDEKLKEQVFNKFIIDDFPSDPEYWGFLTESKLLPDYTIALIENREVDADLMKRYFDIETCVRRYQERYLSANDVLLKTKLRQEKPPESAFMDMQIIINETIKHALDSIFVYDKPSYDSQSFTEIIEKFREDWDILKLKLEENDKSFVEVELGGKSDVELIDEVLLKIRKGYCKLCTINEEEPESPADVDESPRDDLAYNDSRNLGEINLYCPIAFYDYGVLREGKPEYTATYDNKLYYFSNNECREKFQYDITKYLSFNKPFKDIPPLRICVIGSIGSGKTAVSKILAKELGLMHIDYADFLNTFLIPKHYKKVGWQYENSFTDTLTEDDEVVELQIDEENFNIFIDLLSNEQELRRMISNYFERGSPILSVLMQTLTKKLWYENPFKRTGIIIDGYPKLPTDVEDMINCFCIPDVIIELEGSLETTLNRLSPIKLKNWKSQLNEAKNKAKNKLEAERNEWRNFVMKSIVIKLTIDEILENTVTDTEESYPVVNLSTQLSTIIDAHPSGSANVDANLFTTYNEFVQENPEPVDHSQWEKAEDVLEKINNRLESIFEIDDENIQNLKEVAEEQKIKVISLDASRVPVPDERFDFLCEYHKPASKVPAFLNIVDIAGLVKGAAEGQGLGNAFLSHIKACDAIFNLCRAFDDETVIHVDGEVDPIRDLETIAEELRLKDEEQLVQNLEKLDRTVNRGGDKKLKPEYEALAKIKTILSEEKKHIRFGDWSAADIEVLNKYLFLTSKPALYLVNLSEKDYIRKKNKWLPKLKEWIDKNDPGAPLIPFSGVLESKLMDMDPDEKQKFLKENNITSALDKIIVQGYKALQLEYFFTAGPDEVKAWTIQKGTKAPQAAGRIHTDFEKGFIMAEVMHYKDFKEEGSEAACKSAGKYRQQGRNYVVEDGDIIFFKFNAGAGLKDAKKK